MSEPFVMSIEENEGHSKLHGFHLGTDERLARELVQDRFAGRSKAGQHTVSIALMRGGKIVDVFYGNIWNSQYD